MTKFFFTLSLLLLQISIAAYGQCMSVPVPIAERVAAASQIVIGYPVESHCFMAADGNIYTAWRVQIQASLAGPQATEVVVLGMGGIVGNEAQITHPALRLELNTDYVLTLESAQTALIDPFFAGLPHCLAVADAQGAIPGRDGWYYDAFAPAPISESALIAQISAQTGTPARTPAGLPYQAREAGAQVRAFGPLATITGFSPNFTHGGTIESSHFVTISGTGFGNTVGTVSFKNADNGGSSFSTVSLSSDIVSWSNSSITVKVPDDAGTGTVQVNGSTSTQQLSIGYIHTSLDSDFSGFSTTTRQRYLLRNKNGNGGYTFVYNTTFAQNSAAVAAIERAMKTWRCETGMNWQASGTTSTTFAKDGTNVILFDASLPSGVLGRTTSRFSGSANGACAQQNTVWWLDEIDMQFQAVPTSSHSWEFGPAAANASEYDFESVAVHELGHAHGLGHRIAPGEVMNFSISNGKTIRTPAAVEIEGANAKITYSTAASCFNPANSGSPHTTNKTNCTNGLSESVVHWQASCISPETLRIFAPDNTPYSLTIIDLQGKILIRTQTAGNCDLAISDWPMGLYFCQILPLTGAGTVVKVLK